MAYPPPQFALTANIWHSAAVPPVGPPDVAAVPANLTWGGTVRTMTGFAPGALAVAIMTILFPKLTDVRDRFCGAGTNDVIEFPSGSGRFYAALVVDDAGKGFGNDHRFALCEKVGVWPTPIP